MNNSDPKPPKKQGPLRVGALSIVGTLATLSVLYFTLLFDTHLRWGLQWVGTRVQGAEVNIDRLRTSFWKATLEIERIQITSVSRPETNAVEVGSVKASLVWDALLRAKFVVKEFSIHGVLLGSRRSHPGYVVPPSPPEPGSASSVLQSKMAAAGQDALSRALRLLQGFDPSEKLKAVGAPKTTARIEQVKKEITDHEKNIKKALDALPADKEFTEIKTKLDAISTSGITNPAQAAGKLAQIRDVSELITAKTSAVQSGAQAVQEGNSAIQASVSSIEKTMGEDRKDLEALLSLPRLDAKTLSKDLLEGPVLARFQSLEGKYGMLKPYLAKSPKASGSSKQPAASATRRGVTYEFAKPNSYPTVWVQLASLTSQAEGSTFGGDLKGEFRDFSTSPSTVGKPVTAQLSGSFPGQNVKGILANFSADFKENSWKSTGKLGVDSARISDLQFIQSPKDGDLKLGIKSATGGFLAQGTATADSVSVTIDGRFRQVEPSVEGGAPLARELVIGAFKAVPELTIRVKLGGTLSNPSLEFETNLATALQKSLEARLQTELIKLRKIIDEKLMSQVGGARKQLSDQASQISNQAQIQLESRKKQAEALHAQAASKTAEVQNQANAAKSKATETLRKKLPF